MYYYVYYLYCRISHLDILVAQDCQWRAFGGRAREIGGSLLLLCAARPEEVMWLPWAVCFGFAALSYWRYHDVSEVSGLPAQVHCYFGAVNFLFLALVGAACLAWPRDEVREADGAKETGFAVVIDAREGGGPQSKTGEEGGEGRRVQLEGHAQVIPSGAPSSSPLEGGAPRKKRSTMAYLTNLKTFLTFMVVGVHVCTVFNRSGFNLAFLRQVPWDDKGETAANKILDEAGSYRAYLVLGIWFEYLNQNYFMSAFYLISGLFCPKSFCRKGFRAYTIDKLVRLGGPYLLYSGFVGPLTDNIFFAHMERHAEWKFQQGPCWFLLWLLNWSLMYAAVAQLKQFLLPNLKLRLSMPHPLVLVPALGVGCGSIMLAVCRVWRLNQQGYSSVGGMFSWEIGLGLHLPFFMLGIVAGSNDWLKGLEQMKVWVAWVLRVFVLGMCAFFFVAYGSSTIPLNAIEVARGFEDFGWCVAVGTYAVGITLCEVQLFHQYFNGSPPSKLARQASTAAYAVYLLHLPVMFAASMVFIEILKAADVPIVYSDNNIQQIYTLGDDGKPKLLDGTYVWPGFFFVLVLTNLVTWPLSYFVRKVPVLSKML